MALIDTLPIAYDKAMYANLEQLFGEDFTNRVESQLTLLRNKYPGRVNDFALKFVGSVDGISEEDVQNRTARVTAEHIVDCKLTFRGKLYSILRKRFGLKRGKRESLVTEQKLKPIVVCTVVLVPKEEEAWVWSMPEAEGEFFSLCFLLCKQQDFLFLFNYKFLLFFLFLCYLILLFFRIVLNLSFFWKLDFLLCLFCYFHVQ